jgi:hypothetical protein
MDDGIPSLVLLGPVGCKIPNPGNVLLVLFWEFIYYVSLFQFSAQFLYRYLIICMQVINFNKRIKTNISYINNKYVPSNFISSLCINNPNL